MLSKITGLLFGRPAPLSATPSEAFVQDLRGQIKTLTLQLEHAHRALQRAGELVQTLGNGTSTCRLDSKPFKTEIGAQLEAMGVALARMAYDRVTDIETGTILADKSALALETLNAYAHRFNRGAAGTVCKNDAECMLYLAEHLFVKADEDRQVTGG